MIVEGEEGAFYSSVVGLLQTDPAPGAALSLPEEGTGDATERKAEMVTVDVTT